MMDGETIDAMLYVLEEHAPHEFQCPDMAEHLKALGYNAYQRRIKNISAAFKQLYNEGKIKLNKNGYYMERTA